MRVSIMQPYFFPYIGYWQLLANSNVFIIFDTVQFINHGWIERNRILKPEAGVQYISVPLMKHSRETKIKDVVIKNDLDWRDKILRQLEHYKKRAPFYTETIDLITDSWNVNTESIVDLNKAIIEKVCSYLDIKVDLFIFSSMGLKIEEVTAPDEWALNICKALGCVKEYLNPEGGITFFDREKYRKCGLDLRFLKPKMVEYSQKRNTFDPWLSIIDIMMFNQKEEVKRMLTEFVLL